MASKAADRHQQIIDRGPGAGLKGKREQVGDPSEGMSLGDIQNMPTWSKFAIFQGFLNFWSNAPNLGGGYVCFLKSVRKGRFRNVWVWGGGGVGGHSFEHRAGQGTTHRTGQCFWDHSLFRI